MVPLEAPQADGKAGSPEWKLRSHLLAGRWQAALPLLRGGLQATLGFFSRDNPQFYTMARLTGPGKILQLQFLVTPEPQKTSVTVLQKQLFWDSRAHLSIQQGKCFVKYIAKYLYGFAFCMKLSKYESIMF